MCYQKVQKTFYLLRKILETPFCNKFILKLKTFLTFILKTDVSFPKCSASCTVLH